QFLDAYRQRGFRRTGCAACPLQCMEAYDVPGIGGIVVSQDPCGQLSAELWRGNARGWCKSLRLCQHMGIDYSSMTTVVHWLRRLGGLQILPPDLAARVSPDLPPDEVFSDLTRATIQRRGIGEIV